MFVVSKMSQPLCVRSHHGDAAGQESIVTSSFEQDAGRGGQEPLNLRGRDG